jgi:hypothetical protein
LSGRHGVIASAFRFCISLLHFASAFRFCISLLHFASAFRFCIPLLHSASAFRFCIPLLHSASAFRFCISLLHSASAFRFCIPLLIFSTFEQAEHRRLKWPKRRPCPSAANLGAVPLRPGSTGHRAKPGAATVLAVLVPFAKPKGTRARSVRKPCN